MAHIAGTPSRLTLWRRTLFALRAFGYAKQWRTQDPSPAIESAPSTVELNPLTSYFEAHRSGRGVWKWTHYFDIYHRHFKKFVGREVNIMEIGVYSGGSLEMWREYFGPYCRIYGIDKQGACKVYEDDRTKIFIGDQEDRNFWRSVKNSVPKVDVLIDDGGHEPDQQIVTLEEMLPHVALGGLYLCEDIGGDLNPFNSYLHGLASNLNALDQDITSLVEGGFDSNKELRSARSPFQQSIRSFHIYPFVTIIEKTDRYEQDFRAPKRGTQWQPFL